MALELSDAKIAILISQLSIGGAERQTVLLLQALARHYGIRPSVYSMSSSRPHLGDSVRDIGCSLTFWSRTGGCELNRCLDIRRFVRNQRIQVLHSINYEASAYGYLALVGVKQTTLLPSIRNSEFLPTGLKRPIYKHMLRTAPEIIANSHRGAGFVSEHFGVNRESVHVIPNAIDTSICQATLSSDVVRRELNIPAGFSVVVYVGKNSYQKDIPLLCRVVTRVIDLHPKCVFIFVGDGLDERFVGDSFRDSADRIRGLGPRADVYNLIAAADVLILSSRSEGCPNVVLEAMALGVSPVVTDVGDCPRIVRNGIDGFVFPHGDEIQGAHCILTLLQNPALRRKTAQLGVRRIRESYGVQAMVENTVKVYNKLLEGCPP